MAEYNPVCPAGYTDCVSDPAYIQYHYLHWYCSLYGDTTPIEALLDGCIPNCDYKDGEWFCKYYDNEDK